MFKIKSFVFLLTCQTLIIGSANAGIKFILDTTEQANTGSSTDTGVYKAECASKGFTINASSCGNNKLPGLLCPLNPEYTDECCSLKYAYVITSTCQNGTTPSHETCGGRYSCVCDPATYPKGPGRESCSGKFAYDIVNYCAEKYFDDNGIEHETRYYKDCICSNSYAKCNPSYRLHGVGDSCVYNGDVYYASCACDSGYNKSCTTSGAKDPSNYCLFGGKKYYRECNNEETDSKSDDDTINSINQ